MAAERVGMRRIHDVFRLRLLEGKSLRATALSAGCSPSTVHEYFARAKLAGIADWESISALSEEALEERLFKTIELRSSKSRPECLPKWQEIHLELKKPGVTVELLWQEYRKEHPEGLGRSQFSEYYRRYKQKLSLVMRQNYPGGKWSFVDFSGKKIPIYERGSDKVFWAELFVGALGASSYTFAKATASQELPCWLQAHVEMYEYFGGASELTVADNLKSGVNRACRYDPETNRSYHDLAVHYGTCIFPTRAYSPRDKAKAEVAVQVAQRWIIAVLRNRRFYSLAEINQVIREECLEKINTRVMRHFGKSRRELWELYDRPNLKPLPARPYEFATWKMVRLNIDYHIEFERHYYSAPYRLVREELWVRSTAQTVEIFHKGVRVASHVRSFIPYKATTDASHMPPGHQRHVEWTPSRIIQWAAKTGPGCSALVSAILKSKKHPELGYRSALGVIRLGNRFTPARLEKACQKALLMNSPSYRTVQSMLKNRAEEEPLPDTAASSPAVPVSAENLRGPAYYH
jgi:transposase